MDDIVCEKSALPIKHCWWSLFRYAPGGELFDYIVEHGRAEVAFC